jgi:hypothetical protein
MAAPRWILFLLLAAGAPATAIIADEPAAPTTRADIVKQLAQFENGVKTCSADFDFVCLPTTSAQISVIQQVIETQFLEVPPDPRWGRTTKQEEYKRYITTPEGANQRSYSGRLFRDGLQMRLERFALDKLDKGDPQRITAFDGKFVQTLYHDAEAHKGFVQSVERVHWNSAPDENPYNLVFEYYGESWSKVIQASTDCQIKSAQDAAPAVWRMELNDGPKSRCVLFLDNQFRIVAREDYRQFDQDKQLRLYERQEFSQWRSQPLSDGRSISFPDRIVLKLTVGKTDLGELAIYSENVITARSIEFNRPIDPAKFTIDFPTGIPVDDERKRIDPIGH